MLVVYVNILGTWLELNGSDTINNLTIDAIQHDYEISGNFETFTDERAYSEIFSKEYAEICFNKVTRNEKYYVHKNNIQFQILEY